jgi:hypothetical protein
VVRLVVLDVNETLFPLDPVVARMAQVGLAGRFDAGFASVLRDGIATDLPSLVERLVERLVVRLPES